MTFRFHDIANNTWSEITEDYAWELLAENYPIIKKDPEAEGVLEKAINGGGSIPCGDGYISRI